jgi:hypothetical protein
MGAFKPNNSDDLNPIKKENELSVKKYTFFISS